MLSLHLLTSIVTTAAVAGLWQGMALAVMAAALLRLLPRASASLRHSVLVALFAAAAVLPWLHFGSTQPHASSAHTVNVAPWVAVAISCLWLALACVRAASLFIAWQRLRTVSLQAMPLALDGVDGFAVGSRHAQLCSSADVDSPTVIGFGKPRLLLPEWMVPLLSADDLRQIALHECEHLRRRDDWINLLLQGGLALSPLNPALIWLNRRIGLQRELACDAAVVASTAQPIAYATCLTRLAEEHLQHNRMVLAMAAWGKQSELGQRIHALLSQSAAWTQRQSRLAATATAAALLAGSVGLARTPQFVSVASAPQSVAISARIDDASSMTVGDAMPSGLRAVPASFIVKPVRAVTPAAHAKRKTLQTNTQRTELLPVARVARDAEQPRMVRTSTNAAPQIRHRNANFTSESDEPAIRFTTTEFVTPYVAVPVANGWLIFQL